MNDKLRVAAIGAVLVFAMAAVADAQCNAAWPYSWGGYGYLRNYDNTHAYIPHFALYPPVYYSLPVPRTYGYSPFAYPPGTKTPEISEPEPLIVPNKFVPSKAATKAEPGEVTVRPLRIANPYVVAQKSPPAVGNVAAVR
jgi:hypothetical protein